MNDGSFNEAEKDFLRAMEFPANLESERDAKTGVALYMLGINNKLNGNPAKAKEYFTKMVEYTYEQGWGAGSFPEINFYKGLAYRQLGKDAEAERFFALLIKNGDEELQPRASGQYSRSSSDHAGRVIPSLARRKADNDAKANAIYSKALGYLGQGEEKKADVLFKETSSINPMHLGAKMHTSGEWKMVSASPK
jgi:tetratricopeptide (TPR) repeat protein